MAKAKIVFVCKDCGADHMQWQGQCAACGAWNTLARMATGSERSSPRARGYAGGASDVKLLAEVDASDVARTPTGFAELDRVLGGGFVPGTVALIGGEPGAGKSTLLLQVATELARRQEVLYVSGEESLQQIAMRARRLELPLDRLRIAAETRAEEIGRLIESHRPLLVIVDSIQVMELAGVESVPGSVGQVRETAAYLTRLAKQTGTVVVLVGHVTKEGSIAGPKVLEHMIDCFMMLDSTDSTRYRMLRSLKNRFGAVNELGVFAMTDHGLKEVANPSAIFLQRTEALSPGSVATVTWEGTRPLLVEIQALVDGVQGGYPRRVAVGLDAQRLSMHLAVMHRHGRANLGDHDVFANVVGGVRIVETGADLALLFAVMSSKLNEALPHDLIVFGEIGLTGEVRPVVNGQERLREAAKHGFKRAIIPRANRPRSPIDGMDVIGVTSLDEALRTQWKQLGSSD